MPFRFRRTLPIIPGVRLNLTRRGTSLSLGPRAGHVTLGARRVTASVRTGLRGVYWSKTKKL